MTRLTRGDRLAVLTSGGDSPGMNAGVRGAGRGGAGLGLEAIGPEDGYDGLIRGAFRPLDLRALDDAARRGGTWLGSARSKAFATPDGQARALKSLIDHQVKAL